MNCGTVNFAEMMAYLQPLNWYASVELTKRKKSKSVRFKNVHIITDSKYCAEQGKKKDLSPNKNSSLWRVFNDFQRHGILIHWHWMPRDTVELNVYADKLSKEARKAIAELNTRIEKNDKEHDTDADSPAIEYTFNP
jgi:ribonuclease HI